MNPAANSPSFAVKSLFLSQSLPQLPSPSPVAYQGDSPATSPQGESVMDFFKISNLEQPSLVRGAEGFMAASGVKVRQGDRTPQPRVRKTQQHTLSRAQHARKKVRNARRVLAQF